LKFQPAAIVSFWKLLIPGWNKKIRKPEYLKIQSFHEMARSAAAGNHKVIYIEAGCFSRDRNDKSK